MDFQKLQVIRDNGFVISSMLKYGRIRHDENQKISNIANPFLTTYDTFYLIRRKKRKL